MILWSEFVLCALSPVTVLRHIKPPPPLRSTAQAQQDTCVASMHGNMTNGYYVDLASNDAIQLSNTYLLDRVLRWRGVCIEPQQRYIAGYVQHRTCTLASSIISPDDSVKFVDGAKHVLAGIEGYDSKKGAKGVHKTSDTARIDSIFQMAEVPPVIDYMSLDVEGYETMAMSTFPFETRSIKLMTVERPGVTLHRDLVHRGMCVSHNGAPWIDLMYVNRTWWNTPIPMPSACQSNSLPTYVQASDMCRS